jgi:hypothetical protein
MWSTNTAQASSACSTGAFAARPGHTASGAWRVGSVIFRGGTYAPVLSRGAWRLLWIVRLSGVIVPGCLFVRRLTRCCLRGPTRCYCVARLSLLSQASCHVGNSSTGFIGAVPGLFAFMSPANQRRRFRLRYAVGWLVPTGSSRCQALRSAGAPLPGGTARRSVVVPCHDVQRLIWCPGCRARLRHSVVPDCASLQ